jgi:excisionase family DNA binding protein
MQTYPENMNLATAAKYLGVSPLTIRRLLKDREIPAAKIRGRWLFKKTVIDEWKAKNGWLRVNRVPAKKRKRAPASNATKMHPSVARLLASLDGFAFSGLDPADWDNAKKIIAEENAKRDQKLIELAERYE